MALNLAYRWFFRLGLEDAVPDHSTFSVNRHGRFRDSDLLRRVFEQVVTRCMAAGLVGSEGFAIDASVIKADARRYARVERAEVAWTAEQRASRPTREYLAALHSDIRRSIWTKPRRRCRRRTRLRPGPSAAHTR